MGEDTVVVHSSALVFGVGGNGKLSAVSHISVLEKVKRTAHTKIVGRATHNYEGFFVFVVCEYFIIQAFVGGFCLANQAAYRELLHSVSTARGNVNAVFASYLAAKGVLFGFFVQFYFAV